MSEARRKAGDADSSGVEDGGCERSEVRRDRVIRLARKGVLSMAMGPIGLIPSNDRGGG